MVQREYRWLYSDSLSAVWYVMMGLAILGLLVSCTARNDVVRGGLSGSQNFRDEVRVKAGADIKYDGISG